ncbi:ribonuclease H-like domain-containing protein, partial [Tanacetum coccineum]
FLMGLDDSYMQIRSSILSREVFPDVRSAYATISSEESHRAASGSIVDKLGVLHCSSSGFIDEQIATLISLIKDNKIRKNVQANIAEANQHMTDTDKELDNMLDISYLKVKVGHPNRTEAFISKTGNLRLSNGLIMYDVLVIHEYYVTLISVYKLAKDNKIFIVFDESRCYFVNPNLNMKNVIGIGNQCEGLYYIDNQDPVLNVLKNSLQFDNKNQTIVCETFQMAKLFREPFTCVIILQNIGGDLVHLDLWGPYRITSSEGFRYFLTVVDDYTRAVWVYLIKSKDEGIIHQTSCAYTLQQNEIAERKRRHLLNVARSLLFQGGIPLRMWTKYILTATYLINRLPSSVLNGKSPYEMIYKKHPSLSHLRVFGCLCFATIVNNNDKFSSRSEKCVMIGYSNFKKDIDINHVNFFNIEYPEMPNDDERVDPNLNSDKNSQSDSSHSSVPGGDVNTTDFPNNSRNDADSSDNIFAARDEQ